MKFFSVDSPFYRFITKFFDIVKLNFMWLLFSLPIVTMGASTVAAMSVALKMVDDEEGYIGKSFIKAWKENWKQGTVLWFLSIIACYAVYLDFSIFNAMDNPPIWILMIGILSAFYFCLVFFYSYPQVARYQNKLWIIMRNSARIAVKYFGRTMLMIVVVGAELVLFNWNLTLMFVGLILGPGCVCLTISAIMKPVFKKLEKAREDGESGVI